MDISVSQLNNRLALQLPSEISLGLVFVAGKVRDLSLEEDDNGRSSRAIFNLEQEGHLLSCDLRLRGNEDIAFVTGAQIKVGGHLAFDTKRVQYYLLARDVEVMAGTDPVSDLTTGDSREPIQGEEALILALAGIKRRSELAPQTQSELPMWVQKLAPKEVQETLAVADVAEVHSTRAALTPLNEEMVAYLSTLMDSDEEVELTPTMLAQWLAEEDEALATNGDVTAVEAQALTLKGWADDLADVMEEPATAVNPYDPVADAAPPPVTKTISTAQKSGSKQMDWLVIISIVALIVFAFALIIAIFVQVIQ